MILSSAEIDRFNASYIVVDGHWIWQPRGRKGSLGYGVFSLGRQNRSANRSQLAHRVAWVVYYGELDDGICVLHSCDTPLCVNPAHLFTGTQLDNVRDCVDKGRNNNGNIKLTRDEILEIRSLAGTASFTALGRQFNVSRHQISRIINRESWIEY